MTSTATSTNQYLILPFALRGRDFDHTFMNFFSPLYEIQETVPYYAAAGVGNTIFCTCFQYTKFQNLVIHQPITIKMLGQMIMHANPNPNANNHNSEENKNKNQSQNENQSNLYVRCSISDIGRTSHYWNLELIFNDQILCTLTSLGVHINKETSRPMPNCQKLVDYKKNLTSNTDQNTSSSSSTANSKTQLLSSLKMLSASVFDDTNILFEREFGLTMSDRDWNRHTNQGVYSRRIEDTLYEYHPQFCASQMRIVEMTQLFNKDMQVGNQGQSKCSVQIWSHKTIDNGKEELIGDIKQDGESCCQFRVVLSENLRREEPLISRL